MSDDTDQVAVIYEVVDIIRHQSGPILATAVVRLDIAGKDYALCYVR